MAVRLFRATQVELLQFELEGGARLLTRRIVGNALPRLDGILDIGIRVDLAPVNLNHAASRVASSQSNAGTRREFRAPARPRRQAETAEMPQFNTEPCAEYPIMYPLRAPRGMVPRHRARRLSSSRVSLQ
jgi:hypothetical protein